MSRFVTIDDFKVQPFRVPKNQNDGTSFQALIDKAERDCINALFGKELADLFLADWDAVPTGPIDPRFVFIYNAFTFQDDHYYLVSDGIKEMLQGFIYFEIMRKMRQTRVTTTGTKKSRSANSESVPVNDHDVNGRYNTAVDTFQVLQTYMKCVDPDLYPEFKGIHKKHNHPF